MSKLHISSNERFLVMEDGSPFVWIGDTQWFFAKLPRATIEQILDVRKGQGFTLMQVSCREKLYQGDGPGSVSSPNEAWWHKLDWYIEQCAKRGLYVGLTLGWWQKAFKLTAEELFTYGKWVGHRYRNTNNIIWMTLGESGGHLRKREIPVEKIRALVDGIRVGDKGNKLLTVHADYQRSTSLNSLAEQCDFNNWQTSQWCCPQDLPRKDPRAWTVWDAIAFDYNIEYDGHFKPTLDSEAWYENNKDFCGVLPFQIRRRAYFTILAGAFGHTYGAGGIWDGLIHPDSCSLSASQALDYPGVESITHLSALLHQFGVELLKIRPYQDLIASGNSDDYDMHIQAALSNSNDFAIIYSASDRPYQVDMSPLLRAVDQFYWFNPRTGQKLPINLFRIEDEELVRTFDPPGEKGAGHDWVLLVGSETFMQRILHD